MNKTALPKSAAGQAATYTLSLWSKLTVFLKYPELELSTSRRRLNIPIRKYLGDILPGLANRSIQSLAELTPTTYAASLAN